MLKVDADKIIKVLSDAWGLEKDQRGKDEIHRLADVCRMASGQPIQ